MIIDVGLEACTEYNEGLTGEEDRGSLYKRQCWAVEAGLFEKKQVKGYIWLQSLV